MLYTGARLAEVLALDWTNVELQQRRVAFLDTKNGDSRGVSLHPRAFEALANLKSARQGRVFRRPDGEPYAPKENQGAQIKTAWRGACARAGLMEKRAGKDGKEILRPRFTPRDLRHTWATWLYAEGRDIRVLMQLGGWRTIAMATRYTHVNPDHLAPAIRRLPSAKSVQVKKRKA
jgi:integrase